MSNRLLKLSLYSAVFNLIFTPFSNTITRILGYLTIILFLASVIQSVFQSGWLILNKVVLGMIFVIILAFITSFNSLQVQSANDIIDSLLSVVSFVGFYIALSTEQQEQKDLTLEDFFHINYLFCIILMLYAFGPFDFKYEIVDEYNNKIFTMGLGNPNGVALCVMFAVVLLLIQFNILDKMYAKIVNIIVVLAMFYILFLLSSRTVLACTLIVACGFLFGRKPKILKGLVQGVVWVPVLAIVIQITLLKSSNASIQILGKSISTGRPELYIATLREIRGFSFKLMFGNLCDIFFTNHHNGILTILLSIGICGVLLYVIFWNQQLSILKECCNTKSQIIAFIAIIAIHIHASSEAMGVVGTIPYGVFIVVIMRIAKGEIKSRYDGIAEN